MTCTIKILKSNKGATMDSPLQINAWKCQALNTLVTLPYSVSARCPPHKSSSNLCERIFCALQTYLARWHSYFTIPTKKTPRKYHKVSMYSSYCDLHNYLETKLSSYSVQLVKLLVTSRYCYGIYTQVPALTVRRAAADCHWPQQDHGLPNVL